MAVGRVEINLSAKEKIYSLGFVIFILLFLQFPCVLLYCESLLLQGQGLFPFDDSACLLCGLLEELGEGPEPARAYARLVADSENSVGGFGAYEDVYVESASELQETYEAVSVLARLGYALNRERIEDFLNRFRQPDGGFGLHRSTLPSTYYACATLAQLPDRGPLMEGARLYLQRRAQRWHVYFLDDVFWLVQGLSLTGSAAPCAANAATHVLACQRPKGGFARAAAIGIPTLEHTYYALQVLDSVGLLWGQG